MIDAAPETPALEPCPDEWIPYNDLELCGEYEKRREAQSNAAGGFWSAFLDWKFALKYMVEANTTVSTDYAQTCMELAMNYRISAEEKDYSALLDRAIEATERELDVLKEMKRRY
jgi:hypothetical protein